LDVGCGDGSLVNFLADATKKKVIGLDISDYGFKKAFKDAKKTDVPDLVECVRSDAHKIREYFKDRSFEVVTITFTLHHIQYPEFALREIREILADNGHLILIDFIIRRRRSKCHKFTSNELQKMVERAGFKSLKVEQVKPDVLLIMAKKGSNSYLEN